MKSNPILLELPIPIITPRLLLRPAQPGDGAILNEAVVESFDQLHQWMEWAVTKPTVEDSESYVRQASAEFMLRKDLPFLIFDRTEKKLLGATGFNEIRWELPAMEIGYWIRNSMQGHGYVTEAVTALSWYAFKELQVVRLGIRCDEENLRSRRVAERVGFSIEGTMKFDKKWYDGSLRNTVLYACYSTNSLQSFDVSW
jgi:RimJ/RimL family protein N-acetyltransferase